MSRFALPLAALLAAALGACASDINPVRDVFVGVGAGAKVPARPDFVEASRPASVDYMPVGVAAKPRSVAKKNADQVKAMEAELDGTRAGQEARATEARKAAETPPIEPVKVEPIPALAPDPPPLRR